MRKITKKQLIAAGAAAAVIAAGTGAAYAYWTQGGSGTGSATTGTTSALTVIQDSVTGANLYPGGPAEALSGHFTNPNPGDVQISSVTAVVHPFTARADITKPACTESDFEIGGSTTGYLVKADDTTTWSGLTVALKNTAANQDNCKSVSISIDYTANP